MTCGLAKFESLSVANIRSPKDSRLMTVSASISHHSFLKSVVAVEIDGNAMSVPTGTDLIDKVVHLSLESGLPAILQAKGDAPDSVAMAIPVYKSGRPVSVAVFVGDATKESVGVFEVWQPVGIHDELSLTHGYFGGLERFQNVSSFVRFERGSGLPGQVWRNLSFVVHDNLPSHAGFLRAAGASAGQLQVAVGIPVCGHDYHASALLISSDAAPIARGYEVWRNADDGFTLESFAYQRLDASLSLESGARMPVEGSLPGLAVKNGGVAVTEDVGLLAVGRGENASEAAGKLSSGVAIPFYEADRVTNVLTLLL